eukprot:TRINITY_DN1642_c0_g3_i1.p1 TRINITY_DN1642_c0_g3~~TRINITY_DN1642_c0_g3_i1.p1  ORF type:complete len:447 (-),score=82.80 TRINITY_DN1642_c0_g3_i1:500-1840(-)
MEAGKDVEDQVDVELALEKIREADGAGFSRGITPGSAFSRLISPADSQTSMRKLPSEKTLEEMSRQAEEVKRKWMAQNPGRYVLCAGIVLAGCAGFVNASAFITSGALVSHVTGTTAKLGMALEGYYTDDWEASRIYQALLLVVSFLVGAVICGLLVSRNEVHFGKSAYGVALCLNSFLLVSSVSAFDTTVPGGWPMYFQGKWIALYLQSAACGLQNGMCTAHFGAVVRTTHLTGLMTDSGLTIGRLMSILIRTRCKRRNFLPLDSAEVFVDLKKLVVFASLLAGYIFGVCVGASSADALGINALFIPAGITGLGGLAYTVAKARFWRAFERAEADKLAGDLAEAEEIFSRARSQIEDWQSASPRGGCDDLEQLDVGVGKALDLLHDMEARLQTRMSRFSRCGDVVASPAKTTDMHTDSARRIHSAPSLLQSPSLDSAGMDVKSSP